MVSTYLEFDLLPCQATKQPFRRSFFLLTTFTCSTPTPSIPLPPASFCLSYCQSIVDFLHPDVFFAECDLWFVFRNGVCVCDSFQSVNCYNPHCPHHPPLACDPLKIFSFLLVFLTSPLSLFFYFLFFTYLAALTPPPLWYLYVLASLSESILSAEFSVRFPRSFFAKLMM